MVYSKFTVVMDHNPLQYLEMANLSTLEQRWVAKLAEFNYKPGRLNQNADVLSHILSALQPEGKGTEKDFFIIKEELVHACLWPACRVELKELGAHTAIQSRVWIQTCEYSWNKL